MIAALIAALLAWLPAAPQDRGFDEEWARLKRGRAYAAAKTGTITYQFATVDGGSFETFIDVPEAYEPSRPWPVRVQLHGGVSRPLERPPLRRYGLETSTPEIQVHPQGWVDAQWWHAVQVDNIMRVLARLKREYNVDESRIYLTGFSDGATGAYFFGLRAPTPFSAILPLHGSLAVLAHPATGADGQVYLRNLVNRPIFATNGGRDPLYPAAGMQPMMTLLASAGADLTFVPLLDAGHDLRWWPGQRERIETFIAQHTKVAHPAKLSWETERTDRYNRVDWLVITDLGRASSDQALEDPTPPVFPHRRPSGRVDVVRSGNAFEARTRGVKRFALLLSPDVVDFGRPVTISVNGRRAFEGMVARDRAVLRKWADRDEDRQVLYGAEIEVKVP
jgi:predicted esterase